MKQKVSEFSSKLKLLFDKKGAKKAYDVCDRVLKIVDEYGYTDRVVINSWSGKLLEYVYKKYGKKYRIHSYYPCCHLGPITKDPAEYSYCACMFPSFYRDLHLATKDECDKMSALGVQPWGGASIHDEQGVDEAIASGVTLITCNNPDVILDLLCKKGYHA